MSADASIVIVTYQSRADIGRCLDSLPASWPGARLEVIVVDNASTDGTLDLVAGRFPDAVRIESGGNVGFARGTNLGLARATGRIVVWLNPDCELTPGSLGALARHLEQHPRCGAVGPRLRYADGTIQPSALPFPTWRRVPYHFLGARALARQPWARALGARLGGREARGYLASLGHGDPVRRVEWVSGACLAARCEVTKEIGPLDEGYFMYCEDTDWCQRVRRAGYEVHQRADVDVIHHAGRSGASNPEAVYHYYASLLRYFRRWEPRTFVPVRMMFWAGFVARGVGGELGRVTRRQAAHPWWRLAAACWSPAVPGDR